MRRASSVLYVALLLVLLALAAQGKIECPEPGERQRGKFSNTRRLCLALTVQQGEYKETTAGKLGQSPKSELPVFNVDHEVTINFRSDAYFDNYHLNYLMVLKTERVDTGNINTLNHIAKKRQVQGFNKYFSLSSLPRASKLLDMNIVTGKDPSNGKTYSQGTDVLCRPEWTPQQHLEHSFGLSGGLSSDDSDSSDDEGLDIFGLGAEPKKTCGDEDVERMIKWKFKEEGYYDVVLCHSGWLSYSCSAIGTVKVIDKDAVQDMYPREEIQTFRDLSFPTIDSEELPDTPEELHVSTRGVSEEKTKKGGIIIREFLHFVTTGTTSELVKKCELVRSACWLSSKAGGNKIASKVIEKQVKSMTDGWGWPESVTDAVSKQVGKMDVIDITDKSMAAYGKTLRAYEKLQTVKVKVEEVLEEYAKNHEADDNPFDIDDQGYIFDVMRLLRERERQESDDDRDERRNESPKKPAPEPKPSAPEPSKKEEDADRTDKGIDRDAAQALYYAGLFDPDGPPIFVDPATITDSSPKDSGASPKDSGASNTETNAGRRAAEVLYYTNLFDPDGPHIFVDPATITDASPKDSGASSTETNADRSADTDTGNGGGFLSSFFGGRSRSDSSPSRRSPSPTFSDDGYSSGGDSDDESDGAASEADDDNNPIESEDDDDNASVASESGDESDGDDGDGFPSYMDLVDPYM